ncbi:MAG: hypothetical protein LBK62_07380 [Treponema sp.]|jgi:hypothetical protein|nr:hypothetical protein [Treponema sp.]
MKKTNFGLFSVSILLSLILLNGCASNQAVNDEAKFPSPNELCLEFMSADIPIDQYSYLALKENLHFMELDGVHVIGDRAIIIPSGKHVVTIKYSIGDHYTDPVLIGLNLEPGKYYYLNYEYKKGEFLKNDQIEPFISDMPDSVLSNAKSNFEKARLFLEWSITNPAALDGTWIKEKGTSIINEITIIGNKFKIIMPLGVYTGNVEGRLFLNQNWIVLYPIRHYSTRNNNGEEFNAPFSLQPAWLNEDIIYYERTGDSLSITRFSSNSNFFLNKNPVIFKLE